MRKEFDPQCFLDAAVSAMNTPKAVSLATATTDRYGVQIKVNVQSRDEESSILPQMPVRNRYINILVMINGEWLQTGT